LVGQLAWVDAPETGAESENQLKNDLFAKKVIF